MTVHVKFFAALKASIGAESIQIDTLFEPRTVAGLKRHLTVSVPQFDKAAQAIGRLHVAVDLELAQDDTPISHNAEVAFFPPVTGG
jgi:molybdopterin converting factor subunit 1